jgi:hypothetical protein
MARKKIKEKKVEDYNSEDELFYVGINEPSEIRKNLLLSSKTILNTLKKYEQIKNLRKQKAEYIIQLSSNMREITTLMNKLKSNLPNAKIRHLDIKPTKQEPEQKKSEEPKKMVKFASEIEKLERELKKL